MDDSPSLEYLYAAVDSLMVIPYDNTVEWHPVRMLLRTRCKSLNIKLGMRAACSIPFEISVPPGREDTGKYNVWLNVNDEDAKLLEYLQKEIRRLILSLQEVLQPAVVASAMSKSGKPYPPRVNCQFDIDRTQDLNVETDGKTTHDGHLEILDQDQIFSWTCNWKGWNTMPAIRTNVCLCVRGYICWTPRKKKDEMDFQYLTKQTQSLVQHRGVCLVDTRPSTKKWQIQPFSIIAGKHSRADKEGNVSSDEYSEFDPSKEPGPHHFAHTFYSDVETEEEDEEELIRSKKRPCRFLDVNALCDDY